MSDVKLISSIWVGNLIKHLRSYFVIGTIFFHRVLDKSQFGTMNFQQSMISFALKFFYPMYVYLGSPNKQMICKMDECKGPVIDPRADKLLVSFKAIITMEWRLCSERELTREWSPFFFKRRAIWILYQIKEWVVLETKKKLVKHRIRTEVHYNLLLYLGFTSRW